MKKHTFSLLIMLLVVACSKEGSTNTPNPIPDPVVQVDPPLASTLVYPNKDEVCETGINVSESLSSVEFEWSKSQNTDFYDLHIENLNSGQQSVFYNLSNTSKSVSLNKGTPFSWYVVSRRNQTTAVAESENWRFYLSGEGVTNYPPYPAQLVSPSSGKSFESSTSSVLLTWEMTDSDESNQNLTATLYFDTVDGLQTPSAENSNISSSQKEVTVSSGNVYYWRVKTTDAAGDSSFSMVYVFRVE